MNKFKLLRTYAYSAVWKRNMCESSSDSKFKDLVVRYKPTDLQKFILVWTKKYKTKEEIPKLVSGDLLDRARSEARIKLSNILMVMTALASFGAILAGKSAAKRGESVHQMNLDWHKKYQDEQKQAEAPK